MSENLKELKKLLAQEGNFLTAEEKRASSYELLKKLREIIGGSQTPNNHFRSEDFYRPKLVTIRIRE